MVEYSIGDDRVPKILLAYANGVAEYLDCMADIIYSRMNSHDLSVDSSIPIFSPHFVVTFLSNNRFTGTVLIGVSRGGLEFWLPNASDLVVRENPTPTRMLDYADPTMLQQIPIVLTELIENDRCQDRPKHG